MSGHPEEFGDRFTEAVNALPLDREERAEVVEAIRLLDEELDEVTAERDRYRTTLEEALHHLTRTPVPGWSVDLTNLVRDALKRP